VLFQMFFGVLGAREDVMFGVMMPGRSVAFDMRVKPAVVGALVFDGVRMKLFAFALFAQGLMYRFGHDELAFKK
jgi:hypothetical protein